jgi:hypothetical protein
MAYSNFTRKDLFEKFGVIESFRAGLFDDVPPREISDWLKTSLANGLDFALLQGTEKARSEFIIAPIFVELRTQSENKISIFSGWELNVDAEKGLTGRCDFLVSSSSYQGYLAAPLVVAVEAKEEDLDKGTTQCVAEMVGAQTFNEREGHPRNRMYGIVTTGDAWRFLILEGQQAVIEPNLFSVKQINQIFGILWAMSFDEISS